MATLKLKYPSINKSLQVGDHVFYTGTLTKGDFRVNNEYSFTQGNHQVGKVTIINQDTQEVTVNIDSNSFPVPTASDNPYFFFVKDNRVNSSGVLGYYAEVKLEDSSLTKSELFSVGAEIFESSK
jgi:hypothetical protein